MPKSLSQGCYGVAKPPHNNPEIVILAKNCFKKQCLKENASILSGAVHGFDEELMVLLCCVVKECDFHREFLPE